MSGFYRRLVSLIRKEVRQLLRDWSSLTIGIGLPIALIMIYGYGISLDVKNVSIAVVLEDSSPTAQDLFSSMRLSRYLTPRQVLSMSDAARLMNAHEVEATVRIPSDFSGQLAMGEAQIQVLLQGGEATRASMVRGYINGAIDVWAQKKVNRESSKTGPGGVNLVTRMWFNAANNSTWYLIPGLVVLIMTLVGTFLTSLVMAREWERGTLESLFVTPVHATEILLAKMAPYFVVGLLGLGLCLLAARFLFAVPVYGSLWILLLSSMLYLFVALGVGLLVSAATKNQFMASQVTLLTSFLPAMMLSGFMFDLNNVPSFIRFVGYILPATYFMELIKTLFLAGDNGYLIVKDCAILAGYAVFLLGLACFVTRKKLD